MSVYSSNGVFSSSAATPKITRAPALIFGGAVTGDVVLSIVLIVAGDHPDPARPTVTIPGVRV